MMNKKWMPHIIAVTALAVFIVLGLACASEPDTISGVAFGMLQKKAEGKKLLIISSEMGNNVSVAIITVEDHIRRYQSPSGENMDSLIQMSGNATHLKGYREFAAFALPLEQKRVGIRVKSEMVAIIDLDPAKPCEAFAVHEDKVTEIVDYENYDFGDDYLNSEERTGRGFIKMKPPKKK
jgi:hypothetical protein